MSTRNDGGTVVEPGSSQALERTRRALEAAERAEMALAEARSEKGGGRLRKLLLLLAVGAVVAIVIRKMTEKDSSTSGFEAAGTDVSQRADAAVTSNVTGTAAPAGARNGDQPDPQPGGSAPAAAASEDPAS